MGAWIGAGAVIMPGITLAKGTVVGANALIAKSTNPYSIMVGVPTREKGSRLTLNQSPAPSAQP